MRLAVLAFLVALSPALSAQTDLEAKVRMTVTDLFDGMRARDTTAIRATMHPEARLMTATPQGVVESPISAFLAGVSDAPVMLDEQIEDGYPVMIDTDLAVAWTPYRFYAGEQFSHCGTNAFTLARIEDAWQIVQIVDVRRRDCGDNDG
ncbi:nuclear transport factor 2 family protein [Rubrivirga sp.]|uniref:nuclear transport factor 2 family protein n=1 Tax=Rubrivirga sp. TaxID=1885344 RepID=UPI003C75D37A